MGNVLRPQKKVGKAPSHHINFSMQDKIFFLQMWFSSVDADSKRCVGACRHGASSQDLEELLSLNHKTSGNIWSAVEIIRAILSPPAILWHSSKVFIWGLCPLPAVFCHHTEVFNCDFKFVFVFLPFQSQSCPLLFFTSLHLSLRLLFLRQVSCNIMQMPNATPRK